MTNLCLQILWNLYKTMSGVFPARRGCVTLSAHLQVCFGSCCSATSYVGRHVHDTPYCIPLRRMCKAYYSGERASTYLLESAEISVPHLCTGGTVAPSFAGPCHCPAISQSANIIIHLPNAGRHTAATTKISVVCSDILSSNRCGERLSLFKRVHCATSYSHGVCNPVGYLQRLGELLQFPALPYI
jgi:hypothetical protein